MYLQTAFFQQNYLVLRFQTSKMRQAFRHFNQPTDGYVSKINELYFIRLLHCGLVMTS